MKKLTDEEKKLKSQLDWVSYSGADDPGNWTKQDPINCEIDTQSAFFEWGAIEVRDDDKIRLSIKGLQLLQNLWLRELGYRPDPTSIDHDDFALRLLLVDGQLANRLWEVHWDRTGIETNDDYMADVDAEQRKRRKDRIDFKLKNNLDGLGKH